MTEQDEDSVFKKQMNKYHGQDMTYNIKVNYISGEVDEFVECGFTKTGDFLKIKLFENKKISSVYIPVTSILRFYILK